MSLWASETPLGLWVEFNNYCASSYSARVLGAMIGTGGWFPW